MIRFGITSIGLVRFLSGANRKETEALIGANVVIGLVASVLVAILLWTIDANLGEQIVGTGFELFFRYYPIMILVNLPWNNAVSILQAQMGFGRILLIKAINSGLFFSCLLVHLLIQPLSLDQLIGCLIAVNALASTVTVVKGWDGLAIIGRTSKKAINTLLNFGKYTTFTLIGTNLLRNADTFLISLSPLGPAAVALYSIPLKLTELQQIPLRSFVATAFPKMSKASGTGNIAGLKKLFYSYSGALSILFATGSILTFLFADLLVLILSGSQYAGTDPITGFNAADILRVFSIYGLLLPLDRMTGIALDSINKPQINAVKVALMVLLNIIGDLIAIFVFESLMLVAVATILFTLMGILLGMYFLNKQIELRYNPIWKSGFAFYHSGWKNMVSKIRKNSIPNTTTDIR
ncbi:lipopolysaccharide biosynthesis protein [Aureitalea marina]|nr:hypothetical protein [Aureitalea marina]